LDLLIAKELDTLRNYDQLKIDPTSYTDDIMNQIANLVIGLYSTTADFFILHGVTSCYVMRVVLRWLNVADRPDAIRYYLKALVGTYIIQNQPPLTSVNVDGYVDALNNVSWNDMLKSAMMSPDEHTIKFVWTCWKENKEHHNSLYTFCAAQKLGKLDDVEPHVVWPWLAGAAAIVSGLLYYRGQKIGT